jgi:hypothetical protein
MGQKLFAYKSDGSNAGFYDTVDSPPPSGVMTIQITDEEWQACLATPGYTIDDGALVAPPVPTAAQVLEAAKSMQVAVLRGACAAAITAGYSSNTLGAQHVYPSMIDDQNNQSQAYVASLATGLAADWSTPLWCENGSGEWAMVAHTAAQLLQLQSDWLAFRTAQQQQYATLMADVNAASAQDAIADIVWTSPS